MVITLLSDFGDLYPASMKGVILGIAPDAKLVDISHSVQPQDVKAGAFMLAAAAKYFPSGTVHIAVVDPGVGTKRRSIAIRAKSEEYGVHYFVGPDNGLLIPAARSIGEIGVYEISNYTLFRDTDVSATFHGRDIFAPAGAHISKGFEIENVGRHIKDFVELDLGKAVKLNDSIEGNIIFIDPFGNIITNIQSDIVDYRPGDLLDIWDKRIVFQHSYGFSGKGEPLALIGSHGYLEIAVNHGSSAQFFNKKQDDKITVRKIT